jgi:hypothetical protein
MARRVSCDRPVATAGIWGISAVAAEQAAREVLPRTETNNLLTKLLHQCIVDEGPGWREIHAFPFMETARTHHAARRRHGRGRSRRAGSNQRCRVIGFLRTNDVLRNPDYLTGYRHAAGR